jgi:hypothetical protein
MTEVAALAQLRPPQKAPEHIPASRCVWPYINRLADIFIRWNVCLKTRVLAYALTEKVRDDVLFVLRDSNNHHDLVKDVSFEGRPDEIRLADILTELWQTDSLDFAVVKIGIGIPRTEWMKATFSVLEKRGGAGHDIVVDILGNNWRWELRHF